MSLMFLLSIHSCRMRTYLDPVSRVIVLHPPVCLWCRPHLTRPPPRRLLFPQQRDLFFGHHPGELQADRMNGAFNWFVCALQGLGQDGDHRAEAGVLWCTGDFVVSKKGLMIERIPSDVNFWTLYLIPKLHFFFLLAIWGLIWMTLASQTIDIATWSILEWECQFADNVLPHAAFLLLFPSSNVCCYSLQIQPFYSLPPPPPPPPLPAPLLQFHLLVFMCSFTVCMCVSMCRPNRF